MAAELLAAVVELETQLVPLRVPPDGQLYVVLGVAEIVVVCEQLLPDCIYPDGHV